MTYTAVNRWKSYFHVIFYFLMLYAWGLDPISVDYLQFYKHKLVALHDLSEIFRREKHILVKWSNCIRTLLYRLGSWDMFTNCILQVFCIHSRYCIMRCFSKIIRRGCYGVQEKYTALPNKFLAWRSFVLLCTLFVDYETILFTQKYALNSKEI